MASHHLHSELSGLENGPALLLSNSLGATMAMWRPQLPLLEACFKVIRYDTRGHGKSDAPDAPYSFDDLVGDAFSILDRHGVESASIMGLSLGGMTALGMGLSRPDRVQRIVCCAARGDAPPPFVQSWDERLALIDQAGLEAVWNGTLPRWLTVDCRQTHPDMVAALNREFLETSPTGYRGCAAALKCLDYLPHLGDLSAPTLFVAGAEDVAAAPETMQVMAERARHGRYIEIPGAAHIVNLNQVDRFNQAVFPFLGMAQAAGS